MIKVAMLQEEGCIVLRCVLYLAALGILSFVLGRLAPKSWFHPDRFPYRTLPFEKGGALYHRLGIRKWQARVPDMSRILPGVMPRKAMTGRPSAAELERMLQETCVAELTHGLLCLAGLGCLWLWPGWGGTIITIVYFLGNLPFVLIQRYNRPRLMRLYTRLTADNERRP